jgi:ATP-dependent DNA ligase
LHATLLASLSQSTYKLGESLWFIRSCNPVTAKKRARRRRNEKIARRGGRQVQPGRPLPTQLTSRAAAHPAAIGPAQITTSDDWLHEPKLDGYRLQIAKDGATVRLYSNAWRAWLTLCGPFLRGHKILGRCHT